MFLNHYDRIKCLGDNDLPLFGFAGVEIAHAVTTPFLQLKSMKCKQFIRCSITKST